METVLYVPFILWIYTISIQIYKYKIVRVICNILLDWHNLFRFFDLLTQSSSYAANF